jgi:hypothetical protein
MQATAIAHIERFGQRADGDAIRLHDVVEHVWRVTGKPKGSRR